MLDEALVFNPKFRIAYSNKAQYLNSMGKNKEAMAVIEEALKNIPDDPQLYFIEGVFYEKRGLSELAEKSFYQSISSYDKLITTNPDNFNLILNRAFVILFTENSESSLKELKKLQSKYEKESDEHRQVQQMIQAITNINKDDYIQEFWSQ